MNPTTLTLAIALARCELLTAEKKLKFRRETPDALIIAKINGLKSLRPKSQTDHNKRQRLIKRLQKWLIPEKELLYEIAEKKAILDFMQKTGVF